MLDKQAVAASFGRAADTYDQVAILQRAVGEKLLAMVPPGHYEQVVDLGCGTGHFLEPILERTAPTNLLALDIATGMLTKASQRTHERPVSFCCADAEQLPLKDNSVGIIFANLVLQWCPNLHDVFREAYRVLTPGGQLLFSTFGPASLQELRGAWAAVDEYVHVNTFDSMAGIQRSVNGTQLALHSETDVMVRHYSKLNDLTHELKALGAHNINANRPRGLTGRARLKALIAAYEQQSNPQKGLPATYEIYYLKLSKSDAHKSNA